MEKVWTKIYILNLLCDALTRFLHAFLGCLFHRLCPEEAENGNPGLVPTCCSCNIRQHPFFRIFEIRSGGVELLQVIYIFGPEIYLGLVSPRLVTSWMVGDVIDFQY
jgi:hypothetical protein